MNKKRLKKIIILAISGLLLIVGGFLSWNIYFSKYYIFDKQEKMFLEAVERFYTLNKQHLPKKGESREITLQDLYDGGHINDLYIPKTRKLCDSSSWVRVYQNDQGEYIYNTYLKCGNFESNNDHTGPKIVLNGKKQLVMGIGSTYEELGVESVTDDKDGKLVVNKVMIDSSKVNSSKAGSYDVTYTIRDSSYNKTVVTRKVVVAYNLTEIVRNATDESNYYKGNNVNNYLLFSGMLFRIVNVNEDGSIKLISDSAVTNLRSNYDDYEGSNIDMWLKEVFYKSLNNADNYLIDSTYCVGKINSIKDYGTYCDSKITSKVGLLNIDDYVKTLLNNNTSIYTTSFMLSNKIGNNYVKAPFDNNTSIGISSGILAPIRPVVTLKSNLYLLSGDGSSSNPYKLDDYSYAKANDKINTRLIGEYIEYSGINFRIIGIDSNNNVRVIMVDPWTVQPNNKKLELSISGLDTFKFNLKDENNPAYKLNNDYLDYINTKDIVDTEYEIPTNDSNLKYSEYKKEKVTAKILLPKTYELFSSVSNTVLGNTTSYLYIDQSVNQNLIFMLNGTNGMMFELNKDEFSSYSIKAVLTLKGSLKVSSGKGTINKPYILK